MLVNQPTATPTNKVKAGLTIGAVFSLMNFLLAQYKIVIPPELIPVIGTVISFGASYFTKDKAVGIVPGIASDS